MEFRKCLECGTGKIDLQRQLYVYRSSHLHARTHGECTHEIQLALPAHSPGMIETRIATCPACHERNALFEYQGTKAAWKAVCPNGC